MSNSKKLSDRRSLRTRLKIKRQNGSRARLSVFRSGKHIYAQVINDKDGQTVAAASSLEKKTREELNSGGNIDAAAVIGRLVAERAVKKGVKEVIFDRGGYRYHGRVKALAESAREGGLAF